MDELDALREENVRMRTALERIAGWYFPAFTERDPVAQARQVALEALRPAPPAQPPDADKVEGHD